MSQLAVWAGILGILKLVIGVFSIIRPRSFWALLERFPRSIWPGRVLSTIDLIWAALLLNAMPMGSYEHLKVALYVLCPLAIILVPIYLDELLAPRALGGLYLLVASPILDAGRWHPSPLSVIMAAIAYLMVVAGIALVLMPYTFNRFHRFVRRSRMYEKGVSLASLVVGMLLICLAIFVY